MTPASRQLLTLIASKPQGRVSFSLIRRDEALGLADELLASGMIRERRLGYEEGFQILPAGRAYLAGETV